MPRIELRILCLFFLIVKFFFNMPHTANKIFDIGASVAHSTGRVEQDFSLC